MLKTKQQQKQEPLLALFSDNIFKNDN